MSKAFFLASCFMRLAACLCVVASGKSLLTIIFNKQASGVSVLALNGHARSLHRHELHFFDSSLSVRRTTTRASASQRMSFHVRDVG